MGDGILVYFGYPRAHEDEAERSQQVLVQAPREADFAAIHVIARLSEGDLNELGGRTQPLPQLACAGIGLPRFQGRGPLERVPDRA
jgi:hypothetical protein